MTIVFTGGATGGHFYPLIAIAEALQDLVHEERLLAPKLYYLAPTPFDEKALFTNNISYIHIPAGKLRRYVSLKNISDIFVTAFGTLSAMFALFRLYPDVVVSKGGYASVPTVLAAWLLRVPIIIHESDAKPGKANLLAAQFATKIATSFEGAAHYFPSHVQNKIARTGTPIRKALTKIEKSDARFFALEENTPTIFIIGGSQGSVRINETVLTALTELVAFANVIHQTGSLDFQNVSEVSSVILANDPHKTRYHSINYLDQASMQHAAGSATIVVSRAGANAIAEISLWGKPSIIIPIPESVSHDQRTNAYAYARTGAAVVIEEENLTPHLLVSEVQRILNDVELQANMCASAKANTDPDAARILAREVLAIALSHEE